MNRGNRAFHLERPEHLRPRSGLAPARVPGTPVEVRRISARSKRFNVIGRSNEVCADRRGQSRGAACASRTTEASRSDAAIRSPPPQLLRRGRYRGSATAPDCDRANHGNRAFPVKRPGASAIAQWFRQRRKPADPRHHSLTAQCRELNDRPPPLLADSKVECDWNHGPRGIERFT